MPNASSRDSVAKPRPRVTNLTEKGKTQAQKETPRSAQVPTLSAVAPFPTELVDFESSACGMGVSGTNACAMQEPAWRQDREYTGHRTKFKILESEVDGWDVTIRETVIQSLKCSSSV